MKTLSTTLKLAFAAIGLSTASLAGDKLAGPYLGQTPPGTIPEAFAPGIISTPSWEYGAVFAPGMKELYWVREVLVNGEPKQQFVMLEEKNGTWHERVLGQRRGTPSFSTDGQSMFFGRAYKERIADGWSDFIRLGPDFEDIRIMRVTASSKHTIFFDEATREGDGQLRHARFVDGKWEAPKPLPAEINTGTWNAHPYIAPDESYIIWDGQRGSEARNADLYISFKEADGSWGDAVKFDERINTDDSDFAAFVSPDGKYLFFNRTVSRDEEGNSNVDIFWVDAKIIEEHRPKR